MSRNSGLSKTNQGVIKIYVAEPSPLPQCPRLLLNLLDLASKLKSILQFPIPEVENTKFEKARDVERRWW